MTRTWRAWARACSLPVLFLGLCAGAQAQLTKTIPVVKRSVVGVGTELRTRSPAIAFFGTGFVVGDGLSVITNAHVVPPVSADAGKETLGIVLRERGNVAFRPARLAAIDREHDLAHLRLEGEPLPALLLSESGGEEGQDLAFTGFPLGMVLGLHPATHRATLAAITPVVTPSLSSGKLDARAITQLQRSSFDIFQLDGTAYPGNSGSPVYDPETGVVQAVINMVFVKGLKETAITNPSGITYAVPVRHVRALLQQK
ncbi:serine protease [uncultured Massilia sp.]|uniref:S1 family peptidase n=1 Tax=uncultured Massilia sp. TaxID=169973 RepID=UPI002585CD63|nr:serine protease [uncultured Massilia sp.]